MTKIANKLGKIFPHRQHLGFHLEAAKQGRQQLFYSV
jgi:hypothetical protein